MLRCPVVSIIIPAYNAGRWIGATLESAISQTLTDHEIIVVDDGSTDNTAEIVEGFRNRDSRIRYIRIPNAGVGAARNVGITAACGEFIAPLDADDLWDAEKLEKQVRRLREAGEDAAMAYCWSRFIDEAGGFLMNYPPYDAQGDVRGLLILRNFIGNASVPIFRSSALRQVGLYLTREQERGSQGCEDWDLCIRLAEKWRVVLVPEILASYRLIQGCMTSGTSTMTTSFEVMLAAARERNPDLPAALFRWSGGYFMCYLANRSFQASNYRCCLRSIALSIRHDPLMLLNFRLYVMALKSLILEVTGLRSGPRPPVRHDPQAPKPRKRSLIQRIHDRRWQQVSAGRI